MIIKTQELTGAALNWAVAKCEGIVSGDDLDTGFIKERGYTPSREWSQAGPIIERERIEVFYIRTDDDNEPEWGASKYGTLVEQSGPTPLVAAMRCYVASKLGDEVEIPNEIKEQDNV